MDDTRLARTRLLVSRLYRASLISLLTNQQRKGISYGLTYIDAGPGPPATVARTISHFERRVRHRDLETTTPLLQNISRVRELFRIPPHDVIDHSHHVHDVHRLQPVMPSIR